MSPSEYYRGGTNLKPRRDEVRFDPATGLVLPRRGVSVYSRPDNLDRFGGPYKIMQLPPGLRILQFGRDPTHFEIIPDQPMTFEEYERHLQAITLAPA